MCAGHVEIKWIDYTIQVNHTLRNAWMNARMLLSETTWMPFADQSDTCIRTPK